MVATTTSPGGIHSAPYKGVLFVFTASLMYGLYLATLVFTARWLLFADEGWTWRRTISWPTVFVTLLMFMLSTVYTAMDVKEVMDAVHLLMINPGELYMLPMWMNIVKCTFANAIALSADLVLIYRCYAVFGRRFWIIVFPSILWLGGFVCTILQMYLQIAHLHNPNLGPYTWASVNMVVGPGIVLIPFWGSTVVLNCYCTGMLIWRIYKASLDSPFPAAASHFRLVARFIAESGFLYLSITIAHFVVWFTNTDFAIQIISVMNVPIIGIAFNLILIRASLNRAERLRNEKAVGELTSIEFRTNPEISAVCSCCKRREFDSSSQITEQ